MVARVKRVGHPTAEAAAFPGRTREITIDTTKGTVHVHDGVGLGGIPLAREDLTTTSAAGTSTDGKMTAANYNQIASNLAAITSLQNQLTNLMAVSVGFDPATSTLTSTNVQAAIDELDTKVQAFDFSAAAISYDNTTSGLTATNVQAAIDEIAAAISNLGDASSLSKAQLKDYAFATSVRMAFLNATAPLYWTLNAAYNDRVLRASNSGGGTAGGNWVISGYDVAEHALTIAQIPPHTHSYTQADFIGSQGGAGQGRANAENQPRTTGSAGSGQGHTHGLTFDGTWRPAFYNTLICDKDAPTQ